MSEREKLSDLLYEASRKADPERYIFDQIADNLIANGVTVQEWIPVTEGLPENDYGKHWKDRKYYLVLYQPSGLMCVAHYGYKQYDWWIDNHDCVMSAANYKEVTHWMPLPEPPRVNMDPERCI